MRSLSFTLLFPLALSLFSAGEPSPGVYHIHEKRTQLPHGWVLTRRHDGTSNIPLRFALKQRNIENIETYLYDVSHPKSPNYGKHWSPRDVVRTFAPANETINTVRDWLVIRGIREHRISLSQTKGWLHVDVSVGEAEQLMNTEYYVYTHTSGKQHVACEAYHLPEHVRPHVDFVTPSVHFDAKLARRSREGRTAPLRGIGDPGSSTASPRAGGGVSTIVGELEQCDEYTTPICLRTLYGFFYQPVAHDKNSFGIVEYSPQAYLQSDLDMFFRNYSEDLVGKSPRLISIDGGYAQTAQQNFTFNGESDLDLQYGMTLVTSNQTVTLFQTGDPIEGASFNNFLDAIDGSYCTYDGGDDPTEDGIYPDNQPGGYNHSETCGSVQPANVISTSYGYNEADLTLFYAQRQCTEYAKFGLMGITMLFSSGDNGVAGSNNLCLSSNGTATASGNIFNPSFPSTCPYITSVGATMVRPNSSVFESEMACMEKIYSGGGFSNYFAMPDYQKDAVNNYLTNHPPNYPSTIWNSTGKSRAYPDISANGANYVIAVNGKFIRAYGTSASSPVSGAIFSMINDARVALNKSRIGFINPVIYSPEFSCGFNDIVNGTNPGCGTTGFNATVGWDPVTGLGTPNFSKLVVSWLHLNETQRG